MSAVMARLKPAQCQGGALPEARIAVDVPAPWLMRTLLLAGCAASVALAAGLLQPAALYAADAELAQLLRGMALIKGGLSAAALCLLWWRSGHPVEARLATGYAAGLWCMAGASAAIWQLSHVAMAAGLFHAGVAALLWAAWHDRGRLPAAFSGR